MPFFIKSIENLLNFIISNTLQSLENGKFFTAAYKENSAFSSGLFLSVLCYKLISLN